jgi:hypothetical protein
VVASDACGSSKRIPRPGDGGFYPRPRRFATHGWQSRPTDEDFRFWILNFGNPRDPSFPIRGSALPSVGLLFVASSGAEETGRFSASIQSPLLSAAQSQPVPRRPPPTPAPRRREAGRSPSPASITPPARHAPRLPGSHRPGRKRVALPTRPRRRSVPLAPRILAVAKLEIEEQAVNSAVGVLEAVSQEYPRADRDAHPCGRSQGFPAS